MEVEAHIAVVHCLMLCPRMHMSLRVSCCLRRFAVLAPSVSHASCLVPLPMLASISVYRLQPHLADRQVDEHSHEHDAEPVGKDAPREPAGSGPQARLAMSWV